MTGQAAFLKPCGSCPWLTANHGRPHPDGWYTKKNRIRLWVGLRHGESMSCHLTDPNNPVPDGTKPVPDGTTTHECAGALILQQREIMKMQSMPGIPSTYFKKNRKGMTLRAIAHLVERALFQPKLVSTPNLNEPVSHEPLGEWNAEAVWADIEANRKARK